MHTPNTYQLNENEFVDTYGFFTLCNASKYVYHVPEGMNSGKLGKYSGCQVTLCNTCRMHYGIIVKIKETNLKSTIKIKKLDFEEFKNRLKNFTKYTTWVSKKREAGERVFGYLREHNPIYIQRDKNWIKDFNSSSKIGDYVVTKIENKRGKLRYLYGRKCIFIVTHNRGYCNGFLVLPID